MTEPSAKALMARVWNLSERLKSRSIWHEINICRHDGVTVVCHAPGEYWEIDFLEGGGIDVEVYRSTGDLQTESAIEDLIANFGEPTGVGGSAAWSEGVR